MMAMTVLFSVSETGSENDVDEDTTTTTAAAEIASVSLRDATDLQPDEPRASDQDAAILSRDVGSRDADTAALEGAGARPKTTTKVLQRTNTPAVLPKVDSLYNSSFVAFISSIVTRLNGVRMRRSA